MIFLVHLIEFDKWKETIDTLDLGGSKRTENDLKYAGLMQNERIELKKLEHAERMRSEEREDKIRFEKAKEY